MVEEVRRVREQQIRKTKKVEKGIKACRYLSQNILINKWNAIMQIAF